jgi:hypothetical protein
LALVWPKGDEEAAEQDQHRRQDGARVHPAPGVEGRVAGEDQRADAGAGQSADRLKGERAQHEPAARGSGCSRR